MEDQDINMDYVIVKFFFIIVKGNFNLLHSKSKCWKHNFSILILTNKLSNNLHICLTENFT